MMIRTLCIIFLCVFSACLRRNAGTITETDTGSTARLVGVISSGYSSNYSLQNADVYLRTRMADGLSADELRRRGLVRQTKTDSGGNFEFDSVFTGDYLIEINQGDSLGALFVVEINSDDTLVEVSGSIYPFGGIQGIVDASLLGSEGLTSLYVHELDRVIPVDDSGYFIENKVPVWNDYTLKLLQNDMPVTSPLDTVSVEVHPTATTLLTVGIPTGSATLQGVIQE